MARLSPQTYPPSGYRAETLLKDSLTKGKAGAEALAAAIAADPGLSKRMGELLETSRKAQTALEQAKAGGWWQAFRTGASAYPPLALVLGLVEGGVQLAQYLYNELPEIKAAVGDALQSMFDAIVDFGDAASQEISAAWDSAAEGLGDLWDDAGDLWDAAADQAEAAWNATAEGLEGVGEGFTEGVQESGLGDWLEGLGDWFQEAATAAEEWWTSEGEAQAGGDPINLSNPDEQGPTYDEQAGAEWGAEAAHENAFEDPDPWADDTADDWGDDSWEPDSWEEDSWESDEWAEEDGADFDSWEPDLTDEDQIAMAEEGW